ncbi:alkylhydroperoxidase/carboxymuconolactone decarboxylase family protein YurZ [Kribbella steppae]|uniref:Alkylhydroperoxidase/carboxymuconolactone decarboxylase family protein YurZ n=1 Tax=Kribbella steppae TaxID=2512223 RepID=A0A4R2HGT2_9ACTN|nr:carboxymuconolactone decarboxylase family protein [Kribbella steppae]TCO28046.1 alkylhydroperoxidase/carboxymuconolactone decarboxylase family protein YurZ [Kribbella steppae]
MSAPSAQELRESVVELHGEWDEQWQAVLDLAPQLLAAYVQLAAVPQRKGHLDPKTRELVYLAVDAAATHLYSPGVRRHIRQALELGATPGEIVEVIELTTTVGIHAMNIGVPLLAELLRERGLRDGPGELDEYQSGLKARFVANRGYWHEFWDEILELDPELFEAYTDFSSVSWRHGCLEPKVKEFIYTAFDCASTHLYVKGWKAHMDNALGYGATVGELLEVMEIASVMGMQSALQALPVLQEELLARTAPVGR